jgi:hypothetical protein
MTRTRHLLGLAALALVLPACTFFSTAKHWNRRVGPNGQPVYFVTVSKVGLNLLVLIPFLGGTDIDELVDEVSAEVENRGGDTVRVVQGGTENYWYGWSPFTWIVTPVISSLSIDYEPSEAELEMDRRQQLADDGEASNTNRRSGGS